jgi:hypothetical protein
MRAEIGAVLYALGAALIVYACVRRCSRTQGRVPYVSWGWDTDIRSAEFYSSLGGVLFLIASLDLLNRHHNFWLGFAVLVPPIAIAQLITVVVHNRERTLTGPNSSI